MDSWLSHLTIGQDKTFIPRPVQKIRLEKRGGITWGSPGQILRDFTCRIEYGHGIKVRTDTRVQCTCWHRLVGACVDHTRASILTLVPLIPSTTPDKLELGEIPVWQVATLWQMVLFPGKKITLHCKYGGYLHKNNSTTQYPVWQWRGYWTQWCWFGGEI